MKPVIIFSKKIFLELLVNENIKGPQNLSIHPPGITDITVIMLQSIFCIFTDVAIEWIQDEDV